MTGLSVRGLSVTFRDRALFSGVDLDVAPGEVLVLFGPSGVGKTVLLRAIAGLEPAASGSVHVAGRDLSATGPESRGIGMAFQNFSLYPHMTARENIASPLRAHRAADVDAQVDAVAKLLKIGHVLAQPPRALSNGQKQRTALARALVGKPPVLLLDDPLRNVDAKLRYEMRQELPRLLAQSGAATIYVTQDHREAMALGDRIAVLAEGGIAQLGTPSDIYDAPASRTVARLFGDPPINLLPAQARDGRITAAGLALPIAAHGDVILGLRPEALSLSADPSGTPATLVAVTPLHERHVVLLRLGGTEIVASLTAPPPDGPLFLHADPSRALLFDPRTGARTA